MADRRITFHPQFDLGQAAFDFYSRATHQQHVTGEAA
jgi:hypothetical protein